VREWTLIDIYRLYDLWTLVGQVKDIDGDVLEVGVLARRLGVRPQPEWTCHRHQAVTQLA
jgi:hypothetical protein